MRQGQRQQEQAELEKASLTKYRMKQDLIGDSVAYYVPMGVELDDKLQNIWKKATSCYINLS